MGSEFDREREYGDLCSLKYSRALNLELSIQEILLKDYKEYEYANGRCGYSIVFVKVEDITEKMSMCAFENSLMEFYSNRKLQSLVLMFVHPDSQQKLQREMLLLNLDEEKLR